MSSRFQSMILPLFRPPSKKQITDYNIAITALIWQRQAIFFAATVLASAYFDVLVAITCYTCVLLSELLDLSLSRRVKSWAGQDRKTAQSLATQICVNTIFSATAISLFVIMIAVQQTEGGHFTPLFFLFAAALFATMNNHQIALALAIRLAIYGAAFAFIASLDVIWNTPPLTDVAWLEFFTTVFVLYFILDVSVNFFRLYRRNLSHLKRLQREHQKTKKAYRVKSNFLATVSHELRTPLTSIKGALDLVNAGELGEVPEGAREILRVAGENCERLGLLINDVLDVQQIEAGQFLSNFKLVYLEAMVSEAVVANLSFAAKHRVNLEFVPTDCASMIMGDQRRLGQVLSNLISNAVKFSSEGQTVSVWTEQIGDKARIFVRDAGIGIPENARERVFGQFSQVDASDKRRAGGTGLGLHISQQIVKAHNGTLDYDSEIGKGTTFFVELSLAETNTQHVEVESSNGRELAFRTAAE